MSLYEQEEVLNQHLVALGLAPVLFQNASRDLPKPYFVTEFVRNNSRNIGLAAGSKVYSGTFVVKVITALSGFTRPSVDLAEGVIGGFPFAMAFLLSSEVLRISQEPSMQTAYRTETSWCQPVYVPFIVTDG